jgi:radical SAM protein with 4Fe4S-binding SPASM domain
MFISHTGQIFPSGFIPIECGRFPRHSLIDTYQNAPLFRKLRDPEQLRGKCGRCPYRGVCGGSRARAYALTEATHRAGHPLEVLTVGNHADPGYLLTQLEKTDAERAADLWQRLEGNGGNRAGCNIASIDPEGGVHYDQFSWHYTCGNVRDEPFSKIRTNPTNPRLQLLRNRQNWLPSACQRCRFLSLCNGNLRTRAEHATGHWLEMDSGCYLTQAETSPAGSMAPKGDGHTGPLAASSGARDQARLCR